MIIKSREMSTLYILGNGFDIYHGLKARYADFHQFISEHDTDLENTLENYFNFQVDEHYLWRRFEADLCNFNHQSFFGDLNHLDIMDEGFKPSQCFGLEDEVIQQSEELVQSIKDAFFAWIEALEYPDSTQISSRLLVFGADDLFLNFNYTDTLEQLYDIPKSQILYLHNNAADYGGELIFGHAEKQEKDPRGDDLDEYGNSNRTMFTYAEDGARTPFYEFQKNTDAVLTEHEIFFNGLSHINQIIVLGHSLGKVDWPYFQKITVIAPGANWSFSYYPVNAKQELENEAIAMLNATRPKINMIQFQDLLL